MRITMRRQIARARRRLASAPALCRGWPISGSVGLVLILVTTACIQAGQGITAKTRGVIFGPPRGPFNMPSDAAVGPDGSLYVLDGVNNRVVVYDSAGQFKFEFGGKGSEPGKLLFPLGIATDPDGKVYVADSGNHRFQVFTSDGKSLSAVPLPTEGSSVAPDPTDVVVDATRKRLYIVDNDNHKLDLYDLSNNSFKESWGGPGLGQRQFRFPFFVDVSRQGYVFVVEPINTRIQVFNPNGKFVNFIGAWGVKPGQLFRPKGVAVYQDKVFVTDSYLGRVQIFNVSGDFLGVLVDSDGKDVKFITPMGITINVESRRLYVVELKANRVCWIDLE